ncbi:MAG: DUF2027 domain-containing protein [Bacteroidota bacterium]
MNLKKGDKVRYLDTTGGGTVERIIDKKMAEIRDDNGFIVPVLITALVKIPSVDENDASTENSKPKQQAYVQSNSYNYAERDQWDHLGQEKPGSIPEQEAPSEDINLFAAFVPENPDNATDGNFHLFLINDSCYNAAFNISSESAEGFVLLESGVVEANTKIYISTFRIEDLSATRSLNIQAIFSTHSYYTIRKPADLDIKISHARFFRENTFLENDYFDEPAYIIPVYTDSYTPPEILTKEKILEILEQNEDIVIPEKKKIEKPKEEKKEQIEIDLHINKIVDDVRGLSNGEMLNIQINHFRKHLESALTSHLKRIVFIHGIGNGTLKHELRRILNGDYPDLRYQDASFKEYGFGATMVML